MTRTVLRQPHSLTAVAVAMASVIAMVTALGLILETRQVNVANANPDRRSGTVEEAIPIVVAELPEPVWDLEYDAERDFVYFVSGNGPFAQLYQADAIGHQTASWPLPPGEYSGIHREVRLQPTGQIIVSSDYGLVRVDPATGESVTLEFPLEVDGALPGALDPNSSLPGTWLSAFAVDAERIVAGRNNVPYLTVLTPDAMTVVGTINVPPSLAGAHDIVMVPGFLYVLGANGDVAILTADGDVVAQLAIEAYRLQPLTDGSGGVLVTLLGGDVVSLDLTGVAREMAIAGWQPVAASNPAGGFTLYNRQNGSITRFDEANGVSAELLLPLDEIPPRMGQDASTPPQNVTDLVTDKHGFVWYVTGNGRTLWKVDAS